MQAIYDLSSHSLMRTRAAIVPAEDHLPRWLGAAVIVLASSGLWIILARATLGLH